MSIRRSNLKYVQYVEPILGPEPHELTRHTRHHPPPTGNAVEVILRYFY
jgi:hypothetical protein